MHKVKVSVGQGLQWLQWLEKELDPVKELYAVTRLDPEKGLDPPYRTRGERGQQGAPLAQLQHVQKSATFEVGRL